MLGRYLEIREGGDKLEEKFYSKGGRRWHGIETIKQWWRRR
jgi:hypothetical protein